MFKDTKAFSGFSVDDLEAARGFYGDTLGLTGKGVEMLWYDGFDQDEKGIARQEGPAIAWFNDPAGNVIAVLEDVM